MSYAHVVATSSTIPPLSKTAPVAPPCPAVVPTQVPTLSIVRKAARNVLTGVKSRYAELKLDAEIASHVSTAHHAKLKAAEKEFRELLGTSVPEAQCWLVGSFAAGIDIESSDLDFTVKISTWEENDYGKLMRLRHSLIGGSFSGKLIGGAIPVLKMVHKETGVDVDVTCDNDTPKRNTQLLVWYGQVNPKFLVLAKTIKVWASRSGVENSRDGRLNSFAICLILIQFLQSINELPNLQELFPELNGLIEVANDDYHRRNLAQELEAKGIDWKATKKGYRRHKKDVEGEKSLSDLLIGFLKYFAKFDFKTNWISIKRGRKQRKNLDHHGEPTDDVLPRPYHRIVVEDPFLDTPHNCARTVFDRRHLARIQEECREAVSDILRTNSLFARYPSQWKMRIVEEGKRIDMRMKEWEDEEIRCGITRWRFEEKNPTKYWSAPSMFKYKEYDAWEEYIRMMC